ncbi:MAG: ligase-associated DNA damage response endonuclease PdeM [Saprospiraceae bacterium]|nr:ligase-associated DNA damage response endonuclease PdeM [Bacteroidia bacterium]MBT8230323.1 ligase-associated DNA damage response endonuclease PdeM [Bacteroidia bacterium]NNF20953.1 ligase-associated DNA damage response endonuclease PdeM [Saprospiraceae bacterium]
MLLPDKAILWEKYATLLISDLHLGKISHFRKQGIPLPAEAGEETLTRLGDIISKYLVRRVIILGDLFHSHYNNSWSLFLLFLKKHHEIAFDLVMGNHDILDKKHYIASNLTIHAEHLVIERFFLTHHPDICEGYYNICGHLHPAIKLSGKGKQTFRFPCFYFKNNQAILPAFGYFTGSMNIEGLESDDIYAIADSTIFKVL